ncbi:DUF86 domain-containing protein [Candidatus Woesearchaeota archaeon]|nr:DUF86 domain-containing protein [Candidatus Woesearchaeota archaeon]
MTEHNDVSYIKHILDAIADVENSVKNKSKKEFEESKDLRDANIRRIEVMGEAVKNLSSKLKQAYPVVAWKKMAGARDIMIHAYFTVDIDIVWDIIKKDVPKLKKQIQKIKEELETKKK